MAPDTNALFEPPSLAELSEALGLLNSEAETPEQALLRFRLERLLTRAQAAKPSVALHVRQTLSQLLAQYQQSAANGAGQSEGTVNSPQPRRQKAREELRALTAELAALNLDDLPTDSAQALDDELQAFDTAAQQDQLELTLPEAERAPALSNLRAVRRYRQLAAQHKTESMVNRALMARPENPGPLNPHMLAIKSLTHMRDLSLPYLNRFVSYLETVLWLETHLEPPEPTDTKNKKPRKKR